jgi:hypothetical protein
MFERGSRYEKVADTTYVDRSGREIVYKRLRFIPTSVGLRVHSVQPHDRLDLIARDYLGDPLQDWRIADANLAMMPPELVEVVGRRLLIPFVGG